MSAPNYAARGWWLHASRNELVIYLDFRTGPRCLDEHRTSILREMAAALHPLSARRRTMDEHPCDLGLHELMHAGACLLCGFEDLQPTGERSPESPAQRDHRLRELFGPAIGGGA